MAKKNPKKPSLRLLTRRRDEAREKLLGCMGEIRQMFMSGAAKFEECADAYEKRQAELDSFLMERVR